LRGLKCMPISEINQLNSQVNKVMVFMDKAYI